MQRGSSLKHKRDLAEPLVKGSTSRSREETTLSSKPSCRERGSPTIVHQPDMSSGNQSMQEYEDVSDEERSNVIELDYSPINRTPPRNVLPQDLRKRDMKQTQKATTKAKQ